ncbi:o-succinylbenzoate--CoA ligase [Rhodococcus sp. BP-252]|uniref:o-succinylbenzoate--CoA ligase n=1 Tax=unclassified Rhodococcus (in: high G+C Gram-positive bacteria) TaxID=192944 RepID=UPI001430820F|nr:MULTISPECIES: o-succinylbenzoate--CoA ligase [unclassified Rhodococcus (in: high G+C Gram-positive bacteria)]NIL78943.1 putative 2-succinylbenzoate--CoA ligase [Rhodococcus sp. B10]MBY6413601.1 o-succinylbenzoate--CoA ligase [Rhodococcus sp. BP-320]MBY6418203.1 o-succinylbenzoate--CoA ligase [Rhodococcus sp. BP-321]MBY6424795.1 o-succinylbenzoate--CoA ligase [Rhodococcus sp. BP-324]MBY6428148.1 o-succinylbenzoate--CoA ligase [Rhodococcus sp. BP-323]
MNLLEELKIPTGEAAADLLPRLRSVLDGSSPAVLPVPAADERETARLRDALAPGTEIYDAAALVVATSGTTGTPKGAMLSASALRASGTATYDRLGGPGSWLLALPAHHIAGMQVLLRSALAGTDPVILDVAAGFDPSLLPGAVARMSGRRYTSLVPTQLVKVLDDPAATEALASFDAVLLGGAATPVPLRERACAAGIRLVRTYGMSETAGGCVYDGVPLDGVTVRLDDGRVVLGGATVALGYRGMPDHPAFAEPGWFRTDDAGLLTDGVLSIQGRLDEAISTGGLTVVPQVVEAALVTHPLVRECAVLGLPDERLGQRVVAAVVASGPLTLESLREHVIRTLDPTAAPRELFLVDALPVRGPGKVDRAGLRKQLLDDPLHRGA